MSTGDDVTSILDQLRGLLGEGTPVTAPLPSTIPADIQNRLDKLPNGLGEVIERFVDTRKSQADISAELAKIDPSLVPVIDQSKAGVTAARTDIDNTKDLYGQRRDALAPVEGTPLGQMAVLESKVDAVANGSSAIRAQMPPAELRRVLVDELANRYYQQAKAATGSAGSAMPGGGGLGAGSGGGSPSGGGGGGAGANPLSALSGLSSAPFSALSRSGSANGDDTAMSASAHPDRVPSGPAGAAVRAALSKQGTAYVWGAKGPNNFDCSGLVQWAWHQAGVQLGGDTYSQIKQGIPVPPDQVRAGDMIFPLNSFNEGGRAGPGHVQLAIGPNQVVHAPQTGDVVRIAPMPARFIARRPLPAAD
jgi:cell wall-associated NlpC family hydrolase